MVLPTIPLAFGISSSINVTTFENSTSQIGRPNENQTAAQIKMCPTTTGIAPEESENNSTDIECLQNVFESLSTIRCVPRIRTRLPKSIN